MVVFNGTDVSITMRQNDFDRTFVSIYARGEIVALGRRDFLKRSAAGAALLTAGAGVFKNSAFAINPTLYQEKSDISFVGSSEEGSRRQTIIDVLEPWRETVAAGIQGKTILLKVNLVYWMSMLDDPSITASENTAHFFERIGFGKLESLFPAAAHE